MNVPDNIVHVLAMPAGKLSIAVVLIPDFTMLAFAGFVDALRLAADENDRSRPIHCRWTIMTEDGRPVRASNGVLVEPDSGLGAPQSHDYVAVIGGTLHKGLRAGGRLVEWLREVSARTVPLIGICTGSFVLAHAGLLKGRRCCLSWLHREEFRIRFPKLEVEAEQLFIHDRDRITCAGGTSVIHLAGYLIERHLGTGRSLKGLRIMLEERSREPTAPQPLPPLPQSAKVRHVRLRKAMMLIERTLEHPLPMRSIAATANVSVRQLNRLFLAEVGMTPLSYREELRCLRAEALLLETNLPTTEIGLRCGYSDAAHFSRRFKQRRSISPTLARLSV